MTFSANTDLPLNELNHHIIVCGLPNLGFRILEQLLEAEIALSVVVIEPAPELLFAEELAQRAVPLLRRDSRATHVLQDAGVNRARALIAIMDDIRNLETALEAKRLNPNLRIISSFTNPQIGQLLNSLPNCRALDPAELTAGAFVTASLPNQVLHLFTIQNARLNEEVAVVRDYPNEAGTISQLYGRIVPLQIETTEPDGTRSFKVCPPPNTHVQPQDRVYLIGRVDDLLASKEIGLDRQTLERSQGWYRGKNLPRKLTLAQRWRRVKAVVSHFFNEMGARFRFVTLIFMAILLLTILVLFILRGDRLDDAIYFGLNLVTGQTVINSKDFWLFKIFGFIITFAGIALIGVINAYITNYIISARLAQALGQQRAIDMNNHIVLVGLGEIGYRVLLGLIERGEDVVVIEQDDENPYIVKARARKIPVIQADARQLESLELANISKARCITIASNDDLGSLETALNARTLNPNIRVVVRMFDRSLAEKIEESFGIQVARSTTALAAPYFVASALNYEAIATFYARSIPYVVTSLKIKADSRIDGLTVRDLYTRSRILVLALRRRPTEVKLNRPQLTPLAEQLVYQQISLDFYLDPEQTGLNADDTIYFVGPYNRINKVYELNETPSDRLDQAQKSPVTVNLSELFLKESED